MPLQRYFKHAAFTPEEISTITEAFDGLCKTLCLTDREVVLVEFVATAIIDAAKHGMGTAEQIKQRALIKLNSVKSPSATHRTGGTILG